MHFNCYFTAKWWSILSTNSCIAEPYVPATTAKCSRSIVYGQHPDWILISSHQFIRLNCFRPHHYHRHHPDHTVHMLLFSVPVFKNPRAPSPHLTLFYRFIKLHLILTTKTQFYVFFSFAFKLDSFFFVHWNSHTQLTHIIFL